MHIKFISEIRSLRSMLNIPSKSLINIYYSSIDKDYVDYLENNKEVLFRISKVGDIINTQEEIKNSAQILVDNATFYVALKGIINIEEELNRLNRDLNKLKNDISIIDNKLSNKNFINKAPKEVIKEQNSKKDVFENKILRLQAAINKLK